MQAADDSFSFSEMATELAIADTDAASMSLALFWQSVFAGKERDGMEVLAARVGLPVALAIDVLADYAQHSARIAAAYELIRALIPFEAEVRALIGRSPAVARPYTGPGFHGESV